MNHDFYPFVEDNQQNDPHHADSTTQTLSPQHPARIAVYDDLSAAPRVIVIPVSDVRTYLDEITKQVSQLSKEQGGSIPFMVIREVVENFIHAYFIEPTISILNNGNTIRFCDQGPGIADKRRAVEFGTTSATEEMRLYIRGVGSGLPYAQTYMQDKGGSLTVEDNLGSGTIVTLSLPQPQQNTYQAQQQVLYQTQQLYQSQQLPQLTTQPQMEQYASQMPVSGQNQQIYQTYPVQRQQNVVAQPQSQIQSSLQPQALIQPQAQLQPQSYIYQQQLNLGEKEQQVLMYLQTYHKVGPTELANTFGGSLPTWTRELKKLKDKGLLLKNGQKYQLTELGMTYLRQF